MHPRLYLISPIDLDPDSFPSVVEAALSGGDVACLLIAEGDWGEATYQKIAEQIVPIAQAAGTAILLQNDTRSAGRARADGVHVDAGSETLSGALETFHPNGIVGVGDIRTRHDAMRVAELGADYVFFGLIERSEDGEVHPKTLQFADWWSELFETPCVALAGSAFSGIETCAATGADFVAARGAIWTHPDGPAAAVAAANEILAQYTLSNSEDG
ncbi:thiamine phosphate synthase [Stappia sp. ES.058]|uniref:thiamine phosphate synthase n=1 Tax=Stappia sp. ES.058 TaxID=1881061 RepID=UPI00087BACE2|nr:thiamine phosphate synthase [Stappia sp. ES.058]SDU35221.1 thiamine-phosphate diphosphorylase [Stappia sp. ES.058]